MMMIFAQNVKTFIIILENSAFVRKCRHPWNGPLNLMMIAMLSDANTLNEGKTMSIFKIIGIFKRKKRECGQCKHREKHGWCKPKERHVPLKPHEF